MSETNQQEATRVPKRVDDPRDRKTAPPPRPASGSIPGTGYRLLPGARTTRGQFINQDAHPTGTITKEEASAAGVTTEQMTKRWPDYALGYDLHSEAGGMLDELWAARMIPGLSPEEHFKFTGHRTAEEEYDLRATKDSRVLAAYGRIAGLGKPAEAPGLEERIERIESILGLSQAQPESMQAPGGATWSELLQMLAPVLGGYLDGQKLTAMDLLRLIPVFDAIQARRKAGAA